MPFGWIRGNKEEVEQKIQRNRELMEFANSDNQAYSVKRKSESELEDPPWDLRGRMVLSRETFDKFEIVFYTEPIMHAGGLLYKSLVHQCHPIFKSRDKAFILELNNFLETSRFLEMYMEYIPLHLFIFGNAFVELLRDSNTGLIADVIAVDPKTMDFMRDDNDEYVLFELNGEVKGWVQKLVSDPYADDKTTFNHEEMFHIMYTQVSKGQMGVGLIEPVYEDITLKENIEQAKAEIAYLKANPIPMIRFGSELIPPTAGMKKVADSLAKDLRNKDTIAVSMPYYFSVEWVKGEDLGNVTDELYYATQLQASVLGIPLAFLLETTKGETKAGLDNLYEIFNLRFKGFLEALEIEESIRKIWELNGKSVPDDFHVEFPPLSEISIKEQIMRIFRLGKAGLLDKNDPDLIDELREKVNLPPLSEERRKELEQIRKEQGPDMEFIASDTLMEEE